LESAKYFTLVLRWVEALFESEHDLCCATAFEIEIHARLARTYERNGNVEVAAYHKYKVEALSTIFAECPIACTLRCRRIRFN